MELKQQLINEIEMLPEQTLRVISIIVKEFILLNNKAELKSEQILEEDRKAMFGCLRGKYIISDDFDAPLDDFKEYMI